jgi:cytoskeletal protein RodZ
MERKSSRVLVLVLVLVLTGHALAAAWTWRDIRQQPAQQVRGSKTFWRISSAVNTLGSVGYWLIGRRYRRSQPR